MFELIASFICGAASAYLYILVTYNGHKKPFLRRSTDK